MLYPKKYKNKKRKIIYEFKIYIKESIINFLTSLINHHTFLLFLKQKFHF